QETPFVLGFGNHQGTRPRYEFGLRLQKQKLAGRFRAMSIALSVPLPRGMGLYTSRRYRRPEGEVADQLTKQWIAVRRAACSRLQYAIRSFYALDIGPSELSEAWLATSFKLRGSRSIIHNPSSTRGRAPDSVESGCLLSHYGQKRRMLKRSRAEATDLHPASGTGHYAALDTLSIISQIHYRSPPTNSFRSPAAESSREATYRHPPSEVMSF
ncbi:hypothetical protein FB107DRAFT_252867, partial [Schizophyllum commune]